MQHPVPSNSVWVGRQQGLVWHVHKPIGMPPIYFLPWCATYIEVMISFKCLCGIFWTWIKFNNKSSKRTALLTAVPLTKAYQNQRESKKSESEPVVKFAICGGLMWLSDILEPCKSLWTLSPHSPSCFLAGMALFIMCSHNYSQL